MEKRVVITGLFDKRVMFVARPTARTDSVPAHSVLMVYGSGWYEKQEVFLSKEAKIALIQALVESLSD